MASKVAGWQAIKQAGREGSREAGRELFTILRSPARVCASASTTTLLMHIRARLEQPIRDAWMA